MRKSCKNQIKNKVESEKFKEKLNRCLEKKTAKYLKREDKAAAAADRVTMKEEINALKEEKAEAKVKYWFGLNLDSPSKYWLFKTSQLKIYFIGRA